MDILIQVLILWPVFGFVWFSLFTIGYFIIKFIINKLYPEKKIFIPYEEWKTSEEMLKKNN